MGIKSRIKKGATAPVQPTTTKKEMPEAFKPKSQGGEVESIKPASTLTGGAQPIPPVQGGTESPVASPVETGMDAPQGDGSVSKPQSATPPAPKQPVETTPKMETDTPFPRDRLKDDAINDLVSQWGQFEGLVKSRNALQQIAQYIRSNPVEKQVHLKPGQGENMREYAEFITIWDPRFDELRSVVKKKQELHLKPLRKQQDEVREFYKPVLGFLDEILRNCAIVATGLKARAKYLEDQEKQKALAEQNTMGLELQTEKNEAEERARTANDPDAREEANQKLSEIEDKQVQQKTEEAKILQKPSEVKDPKSGEKVIREVTRRVASYEYWGQILAWLADQTKAGKIDPTTFIKPVAGGFTKWENANGEGSIPGFKQVIKKHHTRR